MIFQDLRFKYFFQDANSFSYFMLLVQGFLFHTHKKNIQLLIFSILILFVIILTQSTGGLLGYLILNTLYFFKRVLKTTLLNKVILLIFIGLIFSSIIFSIIYFKDQNVLFSFFMIECLSLMIELVLEVVDLEYGVNYFTCSPHQLE